MAELGQGQTENVNKAKFANARRDLLRALRLSMLRAGQQDSPDFERFATELAQHAGKVEKARCGAWLVNHIKLLREEIAAGKGGNKAFLRWCEMHSTSLPQPAISFDW